MKLSQDRFDIIVGNASIGLVGRIIGRFIVAVQGVLVARLLGPAAFGLYAIGLTLFRFVEMTATLGFDIGLVRYGVEYLNTGETRRVKGIIICSVFISFLFSVLLGLLLYILAPWLAQTLFGKPDLAIVLKLFCFLFPLSSLLSVVSAANRIDNRIIFSVISQDLMQPFLSISLLLVFCFWGIRLELVIAADQTAYFFSVILAIFFLWKLFKEYIFSSQSGIYPDKSYYIFSITSIGAIFLSTIVLWVDRLFASFYLSAADVGIYQAALQISVLFAVFLGSFSRIILPIFSSLYSEGKTKELEEVFRIGTKWNLYLGLPFILFFGLNAVTVLTVLYGEEYGRGSVVLWILLVGQLINLATGAVGPLLLVGGYQKIVLVLSGTFLFLNIFISMRLIPYWGIIGAGLSNSISTSILYLIVLMIVWQKMRLWPYDLQYLKGIIALIFTAIVMLCANWFFSDFILVNMIFQLILSIAVFWGSLFVMGLHEEDRFVIRIFLGKFGLNRRNHGNE